MRAVVDNSGKTAALRLDGYTSGGKTGTAQRGTQKGYKGYITSYIGYAPVNDPQIMTYVVVNNPKGADPTGTQVAAPVYRDIMQYALPRYSVEPTKKSVLKPRRSTGERRRRGVRTTSQRTRYRRTVVAADGSSAPPSLRPSRLTGVGWADLGDLLGMSPGPVARATVPDLRVSGVTADSRLVHPGDLYVAAPGATVHGASFTAEALDRGAVAILTDPDGQDRALAAAAAGSAPIAVVGGPRALIPALADRIYGRPSRRLQLFGITGTNGKTTTAYLLQAALRAAGRRVGLIGTIGYQVDDRRLEGPRTTVTTPEAAELHALLAVMLEQGADAVVMEVSSHALALGRTAGLRFAVAAFTNFGSDHLDFHGDVASYFAAKASLFTAERADRAVINVDDPRGRS